MLFVISGLDYLFLAVLAHQFYKTRFGELMKTPADLRFALLFYVFYILGILFFVVAPAVAKQSLAFAMFAGMFFGFIAYMTYDLTNAATLKGFPLSIIIPDIVWGSIVSGLVAVIGFLVYKFFA